LEPLEESAECLVMSKSSSDSFFAGTCKRKKCPICLPSDCINIFTTSYIWQYMLPFSANGTAVRFTSKNTTCSGP